MKACQRTLLILLVLVLGIGIGVGVTTTLPKINSQWAYAIEKSEASTALKQLQDTDDLSVVFKRVARAMRPSVVSIRSLRKARVQNPAGLNGARPEIPEELRRFFDDDAWDRFRGPRIPEEGRQQQGLGTGVIVSADGYILTNNHVVRGADEVEVILSTDRKLKAKIVGTDKATDVAVLKVEAEGLAVARLGNSEQMEVGDWVLAMGSPFGLDQTVTAGIVSAKGRANVGITDYEDFIQTDAAINPGNSGGPLVNMKGEVIGINTAIASRSGGSMGVGFAIPSDMVRRIMESIMADGRVNRGWLGVGIQDLDEDLAKSFGLKSRQGALVGGVMANGPAAQAGLKAGDILLKLDGKIVRDANHLRHMVAGIRPRKKVRMEVFRQKETIQVNVTIGLRDLDQLSSRLVPSAAPGTVSNLGITVETLALEQAEKLGYGPDQKGVVVKAVQPSGLASQVGLQPGDVIVSINGKAIHNSDQFRAVMDNSNTTEGIRMRVKRAGGQRFVFLKQS
ncbi:MAG: DegQ family serine endoprotease [Pirellulaceae bacterium]